MPPFPAAHPVQTAAHKTPRMEMRVAFPALLKRFPVSAWPSRTPTGFPDLQRRLWGALPARDLGGYTSTAAPTIRS